MSEPFRPALAAVDAPAAGPELRENRRAVVRLHAGRRVRPRDQPPDRHAGDEHGAAGPADRRRQRPAPLDWRPRRTAARMDAPRGEHPRPSSRPFVTGCTCRRPPTLLRQVLEARPAPAGPRAGRLCRLGTGTARRGARPVRVARSGDLDLDSDLRRGSLVHVGDRDPSSWRRPVDAHHEPWGALGILVVEQGPTPNSQSPTPNSRRLSLRVGSWRLTRSLTSPAPVRRSRARGDHGIDRARKWPACGRRVVVGLRDLNQ